MSFNNSLITEIVQTVFGTILIGGLVYGIVHNETMILREENYTLKEQLYHAIRNAEFYNKNKYNISNMV